MEEFNIEQPKPDLDLTDAFQLYNSNLVKTAENELRRQGIKNYKTVAPDVVQNVYLTLQRTSRTLRHSKTEFINLLNRYVQTEAEHYIRLIARVNPKYSENRNIRDSQLLPLEEASHISIEPNQEKADLKALIEGVKNITPQQKKILIDYYIEGKTSEEISKELSLSGIGPYMSRALKVLARNPKFKILVFK